MYILCTQVSCINIETIKKTTQFILEGACQLKKQKLPPHLLSNCAICFCTLPKCTMDSSSALHSVPAISPSLLFVFMCVYVCVHLSHILPEFHIPSSCFQTLSCAFCYISGAFFSSSLNQHPSC